MNHFLSLTFQIPLIWEIKKEGLELRSGILHFLIHSNLFPFHLKELPNQIH